MKLFSFFIAFGCLSWSAGWAAAEPAEMFAPTMSFYLAKGGPDACGRGCDTWIVAEGKIDSDAASRLEAFLQHADRKLPIYLYSPGGDLKQAMDMGWILRRRSAVAHVGRTLVKQCGADLQTSDACLKLKQSGRTVDATLVTRGALCLSACPFLLFGAMTREIAPDAVLAVHSPRVTVAFPGAHPSEVQVARATRQFGDQADRNASSYVTTMGIGYGVIEIIRKVAFENTHVLTRDEIRQFGIDRREFVDTPWIVDTSNGVVVRKFALDKRGSSAFRPVQWRLSCLNGNDFRLEYQFQNASDGNVTAIGLSDEASQSFNFGSSRILSAGFETWQLRLSRDDLKSLAAWPHIDLTETSSGQDSQPSLHVEKLSADGLTASVAQLVAACPLPVGGGREPADLPKISPVDASAGAKRP